MSHLLATTVDEKLVKLALKNARVRENLVGFVTDRLNELLKLIRRIELDIEAKKANHIAGIKPQDRREMFLQLAAKLDHISDELSVFKAPQLRYQANKDFPRTGPIGLSEFREAMGNQLTQPLSTKFIGTFGCTPIQWNPNNVSLGQVNTFNRAFAIELFDHVRQAGVNSRVVTPSR